MLSKDLVWLSEFLPYRNLYLEGRTISFLFFITLIILLFTPLNSLHSQISHPKIKTNTPGGDPVTTINVDAKNNCFFLDNTVAARKWLTQGTYFLTSTAYAYYQSGSPFRNLLYRYRTQGGPWAIDSTRILGIGTSDTIYHGVEYYLYMMLIDWSDTSDNSGMVRLQINEDSLTVSAVSNCITLMSSPAVKDTVPPGDYIVEFSGNAGIPGPFTEVVIHYSGLNGDVTDIVEKGIPKHISIGSRSPNIAAFFLDWQDLSDNTGVGIVTLTPLEQPKNILLYVTRNSLRSLFDEDLPVILAQDDFMVTVEDRGTLPALNSAILNNYDQLWFVSTETAPILTTQEVQAINDFHNAGKGVMVIADAWEYDGPASQISSSWGVTFSGELDHCGGPVSCPISTSGFVPHDIWNGVSEVEANLNEGNLIASSPAQVIATHNGINMVAVRDADGGRAAWDATWYRFTDSTTHPDISITHYNNAQYARNLAKWLAGCLAVPNSYSLLSPLSDDSIKTPVILNWQKSIDPDSKDTVRYDLYLSRSAVFHPDSTDSVVGLSDTTYRDSTHFTDASDLKLWYWKVKAYDKCGTEIWSNQSWSFYVYLCGDCNGDGLITVADVVCAINYLFKGGPVLKPLMSGDANCDSKITVADVVYTISYLFKGGPKPCQNCPFRTIFFLSAGNKIPALR